PREFSRQTILELEAKHIVCDDQSLSLAQTSSFRNCLVGMRPQTVNLDLPTTHDIKIFIHNAFVKHIEQLR
ncbi:uncharacterized protein B0H18DRAFT_863555, partial [Fomitopsis serialis]|uniref:uncharacterized protein n=1 Tax=Fomitopsis serialis TaxID=139415 RepID=UPI0020082E40